MRKTRHTKHYGKRSVKHHGKRSAKRSGKRSVKHHGKRHTRHHRKRGGSEGAPITSGMAFHAHQPSEKVMHWATTANARTPTDGMGNVAR